MNYLQKRNGRYYFRVRIPADLIGLFPAQEIRRSLNTKSRNLAKLTAKALSLKLERVFFEIRNGMILEDKHIRKLVSNFIREGLENDEEFRIYSQPMDDTLLTKLQKAYVLVIEALSKDLAINNLETIEPDVDILLKDKGVDADKASQEYQKLCREILKAKIGYFRVGLERYKGNYDNPYDRGLTPLIEHPPAIIRKSGKLLSEVVAEYVKEKIVSKSWIKKNEKENVAFYNQLVEVLGDRDVQEYTRADFVRYSDILTKFPSNLNKKPELKDRPLKELVPLILKGEITYPPISTRTVNKNLVRVNSLFIYAQKQGYITINYADGLGIRSDKREHEQRDEYSANDLKKLFDSPVYKSIDTKRPERFWIPLIALFSGMRLGEICQLYKSDIKVIDGIPCFDINDEKDKRLKSRSSKRIVPISPVLINAGFLSYVESVTHDRLWSKLKQHRDGYGHSFTRWYQTYGRNYVTKEPKKVFHSFRHNFDNNLKQQDVNEPIIRELMGHSLNSITMGRYGKRYNPKVLLEAVKKLNYGIDLSHLNWS